MNLKPKTLKWQERSCSCYKEPEFPTNLGESVLLQEPNQLLIA